MTSLDALRARRAELARRIDVLDRVTLFVDELAGLGIAAEVETDDGDVIVCIPQVVEREPAKARPVEAGPESNAAFLRRLSETRTDTFVVPKGLGETSEPEPPVKPQPAPANPAPTARAAKAAKAQANRNGLPWEAHEDDEIVRRRAAGEAIGAIAAALGRTYAATDLRARKVLGERIAAAKAAEPPPTPPHVSETPKTEHVARVVSAPVTRPLPGPDAAPGWLRELRARLNDLGHVAPWTPALDLRLAEGLGAGRKLADLAPVLGVTPKQAGARWRRLLPEPGIEAQQRLLAELRARAAVAEAAE